MATHPLRSIDVLRDTCLPEHRMTASHDGVLTRHHPQHRGAHAESSLGLSRIRIPRWASLLF